MVSEEIFYQLKSVCPSNPLGVNIMIKGITLLFLMSSLSACASESTNLLKESDVDLAGIAVEWHISARQEKIYLSIDANKFKNCFGIDYLNFLIWDNDGRQIYKELLRINNNVNKEIYVEPDIPNDYHYHLYVDGVRGNPIEENFLRCSRMRDQLNLIDLEQWKE